MKKTILALLALGAFGMVNTASAAAITTQAANANQDGVGATHAKIIVTGNVLDNTCEIGTEDRKKEVILKDVGQNQLTKMGDVAADQLIEIHVEKCKFGNANQQGSNGKRVSAAFRSTNNVDHANNGTLKNLDAEKATGAKKVNIQFSNLDGSSIRLSANDRDNTLKGISPSTDGRGVIQFNARYYATGQATPGSVRAEAELDLAYE
ncbi:TPA: fimbrial protein [Haemophilus influenzae]|uniref:fimbrial protein n=1 Tax=Haemophilus influenzae TaxID=727 RepID=UPI000E58DA6C|nr:fimbrial protein [Haemophilus influenzae]